MRNVIGEIPTFLPTCAMYNNIIEFRLGKFIQRSKMNWTMYLALVEDEPNNLGGCVLAAVRRGRISHQCQFQRSESVHSTVTLKRVDIYRPGQPNVLSGLCDPHHESHTCHRHTPGLVRFADNSYPSILILGGRCACAPSEIKRLCAPRRASDCYRSEIPGLYPTFLIIMIYIYIYIYILDALLVRPWQGV